MANNTLVGWVSSTPGRDTGSIISTCVLTMGLCVWSALHLNIGPRGQSFRHEWFRNVLWITLGIFAPELVVLCSFNQYSSTVSLLTFIKEIDADKQSSEVPVRTLSLANADESILTTILSTDIKPSYEWKTIHGFYAAMGGFAFEIDDELEELLKTGLSTRRLTITPRGIKLLAQCGLLPAISADEIKDKSKADSLGKLLVVVQASWFLCQTIARVAYDLPVTLLEVNTVGHVVCAFMIYCLWWHKPRQIQEPTIISGPWTRSMIAFMWMSSTISQSTTSENAVRKLFFNYDPIPEFARLSFSGQEHHSSDGTCASNMTVQVHSKDDVIVRKDEKPAATTAQLHSDQLPPLNPF